MKIVITGARGYIGARLSEFLSKQGHEIVAVCSSSIPEDKEWTKSIHQFIIGDIRKQETINEIIASNADAIVHLVSLDHHDSELDPNMVSQVNVQPTWNLLQACNLKENNTVRKFIYFSTIHVYGKNQKGEVTEDRRTTPFNTYGLTHALSEEICNFYAAKSNIECVNIRLSNSYGEPVFFDAKCWSLIVNDLTRSAFENKKIVLRSDGSAIRDFIHYSDICGGVLNLLESNVQSAQNNTIHFSSSVSISMLDVAVEVRKVYKDMYGVEIPIYVNSDELWSPISGEKEVVVDEISNLLARQRGMTFDTPLAEGIKSLFNYLEKRNAIS